MLKTFVITKSRDGKGGFAANDGSKGAVEQIHS